MHSSKSSNNPRGPVSRTTKPARIPDFDKHMLISEREVSELTSTPRGTLSRWRCAGKGPTWFKLERSVRYRLEDVLSFIEKSKRSPVRARFD